MSDLFHERLHNLEESVGSVCLALERVIHTLHDLCEQARQHNEALAAWSFRMDQVLRALDNELHGHLNGSTRTIPSHSAHEADDYTSFPTLSWY